MKKLIEYRIETESNLKKVYLMWTRFFKNDPLWHFTLEGSYIEVRLSKKNPALEKYLHNKKWNYTSFSYIDAMDTTRRYQLSYQKIFNGYSEIIMQVIDLYKGDKKKEQRNEWIRKTIERSVHLCFNLNGFDCYQEAKWLADYSVGRAHYGGYLQRQEEEKKENK